jgi:hypothetical protein
MGGMGRRTRQQDAATWVPDERAANRAVASVLSTIESSLAEARLAKRILGPTVIHLVSGEQVSPGAGPRGYVAAD